MKVVFHDDFDYRVEGAPAYTVAAYVAGEDPVTIPREHAEAAIKAGKAREFDSSRAQAQARKAGRNAAPEQPTDPLTGQPVTTTPTETGQQGDAGAQA